MATILATDDDPIIQRILGHTLKKEGHTVILASHGFEALDLLAENTVDLIIIDLLMPHMDGLTLLNRIRNHQTCGNLPVIMLTAKGMDSAQLMNNPDRIDALLNKPTSSRELVETVNHLLSR